MGNAMNIEEALEKYRFYHCIELKNGSVTPGIKNFIPFQKMVLETMDGLAFDNLRVLDIGCRDGLFSFEAERRGAAEVIGIDNDLSEAATEFLIPHFESGVKMRNMNLFDLSVDVFGQFDVIIFAGVLYHLRYPFWALRLIRDVAKPGAKIILETSIINGWDEHSLMFCPAPAESPADPSSVSFFNERGLITTLTNLGLRVENSRRLFGTGRQGGRIGSQLRELRKRLFPKRYSELVQDRMVCLCTVDRSCANDELLRYWDGHHNSWDVAAREGLVRR